MVRRLKLHEELQKFIGEENKVYFQPPSQELMNPPYIMYSLNTAKNMYAQDQIYISRCQYTVTIVTTDPDLDVNALSNTFENCKFDRPYCSNNLRHYVYTLYY